MSDSFSGLRSFRGDSVKISPWFKTAICLVFALLIPWGASSADDTELGVPGRTIHVEAAEKIDLSYSVYVFKGDKLDWRAVAEQDIESGQLNPGEFLNIDEFGGSPLWVRADFSTGQLDPNDEWLFGLDSGFGGDITLYLLADGQLIQETILSSKETFSERPHPHRFIHFPLQLPANANLTLIFTIEKAANPFFYPNLTTEILLTESEIFEASALGFAFGVLAIMMFYHLVLAAATLDKSYFMYSLYLVSSGMWMLVYRGLSFKYLWPEYPWVEVYLGPVFIYMPVLVGITFTLQFLELPRISKNFTRFFYGLFGFMVALVIIRILFPETNILLLSLTSLAAYASFIYAGYFAMRNGVVHGRYYLIAWTIYSLSIVNFLSGLSRGPVFLPGEPYWVMIVSYDAQVLLLALALAHRIRTMRQSTMEAEADNKAKSEFLARMSHEIRTPLSGVLGMAELLSDRLKDKTNIYYTNIIRSSGTSLLTIINDILDYSKFSSGKMELEKIPFSLQRLAVDSLDIFKVKAAEKNIELIADLDLDMPSFVLGDPNRVKQVILNFISNAIKFTEKGQIVLRIHLVAGQEDMVRIAVIDSGEGISKVNQQKLFKAFSQASTSTARIHGGTGLGLSISKQLAYLMAGDIGVESEEGKGSTFWITAKLPKSDFVQRSLDASDIDLSGYKLLIVEDNYTFAELLQSQARTWGMDSYVARDGEEGLEVLEREFEKGNHFDLISLDLVMPKMDGLETSRRIQQDPRFKNIPRLLLTSATNFPAPHTLSAAGIKRIKEKPTLPAELKQAYKELLSKDEAQDGDMIVSSDESKSLAKLSILVAEDNSVNQMVIDGILKRLDQSVTLVEDGEKALRAVQEGTGHFDLVLMDCDMPVMDGISATKHIREWEQKNEKPPIRIVALTAHAVQTQVDECFEAGMDEYLSKPIDISKLEKLLKQFSEAADQQSRQVLERSEE